GLARGARHQLVGGGVEPVGHGAQERRALVAGQACVAAEGGPGAAAELAQLRGRGDREGGLQRLAGGGVAGAEGAGRARLGRARHASAFRSGRLASPSSMTRITAARSSPSSSKRGPRTREEPQPACSTASLIIWTNLVPLSRRSRGRNQA